MNSPLRNLLSPTHLRYRPFDPSPTFLLTFKPPKPPSNLGHVSSPSFPPTPIASNIPPHTTNQASPQTSNSPITPMHGTSSTPMDLCTGPTPINSCSEIDNHLRIYVTMCVTLLTLLLPVHHRSLMRPQAPLILCLSSFHMISFLYLIMPS